MRHLKSFFNFPNAFQVRHTTCKQVLFEQLAKILSGGRSSQIVDLTHKLPERPTPKFSEAVASCDRASFRISFNSQKNGRCLGGPHKIKKVISVYQRTCCGANLPDNPPKKSGHTS
jgi:hypothetical protein